MARLAVFTDRLPDDPSWKGAYTWEIIRTLCESQHEVAVFTTENPDLITLTHSRLTVGRPAPAFTADKLPKWAQAVLAYRPEVIHTFALRKTAVWPSLTIWPYLDAVCKVLPNLKRISTMFDREDFTVAPAWHMGADSWTVFSGELESEARRLFQGRVDVVPLDEAGLPDTPEGFEERGFLFVPAPVSEWRDRGHGLAQLADFLVRNPDVYAHINGGWGDLSLSERRRGWSALMNVAKRVKLIEPQPLDRFLGRLRAASHVWIESLPADSWRYILTVQAARSLGKELIGFVNSPTLPAGSTANSFSRLYLS